jgi:FKBP-type peptidyl-prolyl cis-trans isomerase
MKKLLIFTCLSFCAFALHARAIQEDMQNAEEKTRVSYSFGMIIGANLRSAEIEFDYNAFTEGVRAMLENAETQFTEQEAIEIVEAALQGAMDRKSEENRKNEVDFLVSNSQRAEVSVTESGLQYEVLVEADGEKPLPDSIVKVKYVGTFMDGSPFDSSEEEGAYIPLEYVIRGWTEGLLLMSVGSKYRFYIPSVLAYGKDGIPSIIPPYATLIFTVDLLEIIENNNFAPSMFE